MGVGAAFERMPNDAARLSVIPAHRQVKAKAGRLLWEGEPTIIIRGAVAPVFLCLLSSVLLLYCPPPEPRARRGQ